MSFQKQIYLFLIVISLLFYVFLLFYINISYAGATSNGSLENNDKVFKDCVNCPEMVVVPIGTFLYGENSKNKTQVQATKIEISAPFALSRFEITWDEWLFCVKENECKGIPSDHGWGKGRLPIINVSWFDANDYVNFLSKKTGKSYRLPTEIEWEYSAKGATNTLYWWGDDAGKGRANCRKCGTKWDGRGSAPVGSFSPNPFGLYDMNGNVWEWMSDCWIPFRENDLASTKRSNKQNCQERVVKSGSWYYIPSLMIPEVRDKYPQELFSYNIGIRVIRDMD